VERQHKHTLQERNEYGLRLGGEQAYCRRRGLVPTPHFATSCACAHLLLQQDCPPGSSGCQPDPDWGWRDHVSVYTRVADGKTVIVYQPYCPPTNYNSINDSVKAFADKWGLKYMISNEQSFYRPGRSLLIELCAPLPVSEFKVEYR